MMFFQPVAGTLAECEPEQCLRVAGHPEGMQPLAVVLPCGHQDWLVNADEPIFRHACVNVIDDDRVLRWPPIVRGIRQNVNVCFRNCVEKIAFVEFDPACIDTFGVHDFTGKLHPVHAIHQHDFLQFWHCVQTVSGYVG